MTDSMTEKTAEPVAMPEPFDYCYEWDGPYGTRKFSTAPHNGRKPDRAVPLYTADQLRAYAEERVQQERERCANDCAALLDLKEEARAEQASREARGSEDELPRLRHWATVSTHNAAIRRCIAAIRKEPR